jgi:hypothetical protein
LVFGVVSYPPGPILESVFLWRVSVGRNLPVSQDGQSIILHWSGDTIGNAWDRFRSDMKVFGSMQFLQIRYKAYSHQIDFLTNLLEAPLKLVATDSDVAGTDLSSFVDLARFVAKMEVSSACFDLGEAWPQMDITFSKLKDRVTEILTSVEKQLVESKLQKACDEIYKDDSFWMTSEKISDQFVHDPSQVIRGRKQHSAQMLEF